MRTATSPEHPDHTAEEPYGLLSDFRGRSDFCRVWDFTYLCGWNQYPIAMMGRKINYETLCEQHYTPYDIIWKQICIDGIKYGVLHKQKKDNHGNKGEWFFRAIVEGVEDTNIRELAIPESVEFCGMAFPVTWIGHLAFMNCDLLERIHFPKTLQMIELGAFIGCHSLDNVILPDVFQRIANEGFAYCQNLKRISVKNQSEISIGEDVFIGCNKKLEIINRDERA